MHIKNPLSDQDLSICGRVAWLRLNHNLSREDWSRLSGVTAGRIARIELGRCSLYYEDFRRLMPWLLGGPYNFESMRPVNPIWLMNGQGSIRLVSPLFLPSTLMLKIPYTTGFIEFMDENMDIINSLIYDPSHCTLPPQWLQPYLEYARQLKTWKNQIDGYKKAVDILLNRTANEVRK